MKLHTALAALAGLGLWATAASAVPIQGNSNNSAFSNISGCAGDNCRLTNGNATVNWGYSTFFGIPVANTGSTLTAENVSWNTNTPANDIVLAQLTWFNASTSSSITPDDFSVNYNLVLNFTNPAGTTSGTIPLTITNTTNPPGDTTTGLSLGSLAGLIFNLNGVTVSDLRYRLDTPGSNPDTFNSATGAWFNPENNTSRLVITADFAATPVPEPGTLALLGAGLLAVGAARRRRGATAGAGA